jgi:paraquat-inducible protein B
VKFSNIILILDKVDDMKSIQQNVDCVSKIPTAHFGHNILMVSTIKVVQFSGAVGDTKNFDLLAIHMC